MQNREKKESLVDRLNKCVEEAKPVEALLALKLAIVTKSDEEKLNQFSFPKLIHILNQCNKEELSSIENWKKALKKRVQLLLEVILLKPTYLDTLQGDVILFMFKNLDFVDAQKLVDYICNSRPSIFTDLPNTLTNMLSLKNHYLVKQGKAYKLLIQGFENYHRENYEHLYTLLKEIEDLASVCNKKLESQDIVKIISKLYQMYFLTYLMILHTNFVDQGDDKFINEQMEKFLYPFADILLYLLACKNHLEKHLLTTPVLVTYNTQGRPLISLASSIAAQLHDLAVAFANYGSYDDEVTIKSLENLCQKEQYQSIMNSVKNQQLIASADLINLNKQICADGYFVNRRSKGKLSVELFPKKRLARNSGYSTREADIKKLDSKMLNPNMVVTEQLMDSLQSVRLNQLSIINELLDTCGIAKELMFVIDDKKFVHSRRIHKPAQREVLLRFNLRDMVDMLCIAKSLMLQKKKIFSLETRKSSEITIFDPIYFLLLTNICRDLDTLLVNLSSDTENNYLDGPLCGAIHKFVDTCSFSRKLIDSDSEEEINIDKVYPEWTTKMNRILMQLVEFLEKGNVEIENVPSHIIHSLNDLGEKYYSFQGCNSIDLFSGISKAHITADNLEVKIVFNARAQKHSELFKKAFDIIEQKYEDDDEFIEMEFAHYFDTRTHTIFNFREIEKRGILTDLITEFHKLLQEENMKIEMSITNPLLQPQESAQELPKVSQEVQTTNEKSDTINQKRELSDQEEKNQPMLEGKKEMSVEEAEVYHRPVKERKSKSKQDKTEDVLKNIAARKQIAEAKKEIKESLKPHRSKLEETKTTEITKKPDTTKKPEATKKSEATKKPEATKKSEETKKPEATKKSEAIKKPEVIKKKVVLAATETATKKESNIADVVEESKQKHTLEIVLSTDVKNLIKPINEHKLVLLTQNHPDLQRAFHYYHQLAQDYNGCINVNENKIILTDSQVKYSIYYNCLRLLDYLKKNEFIESKHLKENIRHIRNILAHQADVILHSNQYDDSLVISSYNSIASLSLQLCALAIRSHNGKIDRLEQAREEDRINRLLENNTIYKQLYSNDQSQRYLTHYAIHNILDSVDYIHGLMHNKDSQILNIPVATLLDTNPSKRDAIKMHLFELGLMITQFKGNAVVRNLLKSESVKLELNNYPYLSYFRDNFKNKLSACPTHARLNCLLHLLVEMRNIIAHDHNQEHAEYPEEFDTLFIYEVSEALHQERNAILQLVRSVESPKTVNVESAQPTKSATMTNTKITTTTTTTPTTSISTSTTATTASTPANKTMSVQAPTFKPKQPQMETQTLAQNSNQIQAQGPASPRTLNPKASEFKPARSMYRETIFYVPDNIDEQEYEQYQNENPYPYPPTNQK